MIVSGRTTSWSHNQGASISSSSCTRPGSTTGATSRPWPKPGRRGASNGPSWIPPSRPWRRSKVITPIRGRRSSPRSASGSPRMMRPVRPGWRDGSRTRCSHARIARVPPNGTCTAREQPTRWPTFSLPAWRTERPTGPIARSSSSRPSRPRAGRRWQTRSAGSDVPRTPLSTNPSSSGRSRMRFVPRPSILHSPPWWCRRAFPSGRALMPRSCGPCWKRSVLQLIARHQRSDWPGP